MSDKKTEPVSTLDKAIESILLEMENHTPFSEEYAKMVDQLEQLMKIKSTQKTWKEQISPDAMIAVAGNLAGIGMILNYERVGVVASKALGLIIRSRI